MSPQRDQDPNHYLTLPALHTHYYYRSEMVAQNWPAKLCNDLIKGSQINTLDLQVRTTKGVASDIVMEPFI